MSVSNYVQALEGSNSGDENSEQEEEEYIYDGENFESDEEEFDFSLDKILGKYLKLFLKGIK